MNYDNLTLLTDLYELTMMQGYFKSGATERVVFDAFYRKNPFESGYAIACGLEQVIEQIKNLRFSYEDIQYLRSLNTFDDDFLDYKIHLHGYAARYAKTKVWGDNQTIVPDRKNPGPDDDGIILSFRTNQLMCVQRWVWKWADEACPIEPKELVEDWLEKREKINLLKIQPIQII